MTTIADLTHLPRASAPPDPNPLTERDALQEAQLLALRFDALAGTASLLFELRLALQLSETNTGVLVARGVRRLAWSGPERATRRTAWTVGGSAVQVDGGLFRMRLGMWPSPGAQLELATEEVAFFAGDVPGLGEVPSDYVEDDDESIRANLANWDSPFTVVGAAHLDG